MQTVAGSLIRDARLRTGLTQRALAGLASTSQSTIAAYENGRKTPNLDTLIRILRATGLDLRMRLQVADDHDEWLARYAAGIPADVRARSAREGRAIVERARDRSS
jgi:transcriptional regulator with XRE-family HTH domain